MRGPPALDPAGGLTGRTLGEFVVRDKLGEGGFGEVYRAEQPVLGREAVIKVLHTQHHASQDVTQRFLREARVASRLDHPYAAHIYAFGAEPDGLLWIAMELVRGTPLDKVLAAQGRLPLERLVPLLDRLCEVVHTAHEQGIVHRDLKPANVMVIARAGRMLPKLLDLGIAKLTGDAPEAAAALDESASVDVTGKTQAASGGGSITRRGDVIGSPRYMAPEQWVNAADLDGRTDVYALGVLAWEALVGRPPFSGETIGALARAHAMDPVPPLGEGLPPALDAVFARALAKRPADRFPSALELAAAVRAAAGLSGETAELPRLEEEVHDLWLAEAPQPLAEAVAVLDGARNVHQAREAIHELVRTLFRWLALLGLAARSRLGPGSLSGSDGSRRTVEALQRRQLGNDDWLAIARDLARPYLRRPDAHPLPELVRFFAGDLSLLEPFADEASAPASESDVRARLAELLPALARLLRALAWVFDYPLVVSDGDIEVWMGVRRAPRRMHAASLRVGPEAKSPLLVDKDGLPVVSLWPLMQVAAPTPGAPRELFVLDGRGRRGARMVAAPRGFEMSDEVVWDWFGAELLGQDESAQPVVQPYRGLAAFTASDAGLFFGRERETEAFVNRLRVTPLVAVVGPSGAGKSSFVQAGVVPHLFQGWRALIMRPGAAPMAALDAVLAGAPAGATPAERLRALAAAGGETIVLVVDQLEELVTLCADPAERLAFAHALVDAARSAADPVRVICTLRDDFLVRVGEIGPLRDRLPLGLQLLATPGDDDLLRIVSLPAERAGFAFDDPELPARMVAEAAASPGALALLSFTAARLWDQRDRHFKRLTRKAYDAMGGVAGALAQHAEDTRAGMTAEEQRLVREAFRHLVTADGTRAVLSRDELEQTLGRTPAARAVVDKLIEARLLVAAETEAGAPRVEIVHEALLVAWPRLVEWRREDAEGARLRDQLRAAARQWDERGRPKGLLWRDDALAEYERWRARFPGALTAVEDAFGAASRADAARGRRARRLLLGGIMFGLAAGLVITLTLAKRASDAQGRAETGLIRQYQEQGRQLLLGGDAMRAYPYLLEAYRRGGANPPLMFLLGRAGRMLDRQILTLRHGGPVNDAVFSPDETVIATASDDKTARLWDAKTGALRHELRHDDKVYTVSFSPDGKSVATASYDKTAAIWDVATGERRHVLAGHTDRVYVASWSPDGRRLLTTSRDASARLWQANGESIAVLSGHSKPITVGRFTRDGTRVLTGSHDGSVRAWDGLTGAALGIVSMHEGPVWGLDTGNSIVGSVGADRVAHLVGPGQEPRLLSGHREEVRSVAISGDETLIATGSRDGTARIWSTVSRESFVPLIGHRGVVETLAFHPDGGRIATGSYDETAWVWDIDTGRPVAVLAGHAGMVWRTRFSPSGGSLITASFDGTAKVWLPDDSDLVAARSVSRSALNVLVYAGDDEIVAGDADGQIVWLSAITLEQRRRVKRTPPISATRNLQGEALLVEANVVTSLGAPRQLEVLTEDSLLTAIVVGDDLVTAGPGGEMRIRSRDGRERARWQAHKSEIWDIAATNGRVVTAAQDGRMTVWDLGTRVPVWEKRWDLAVNAVAARADGALLASGHVDRSIRIWTAAGDLLRTLEGHTDVLQDVLFIGTGDLVTSTGNDGTLRVWDAKTGEVLAVFELGATGMMLGAAADGRSVAVGSRRGEVTLWNTSLENRGPTELEGTYECRVPFAVVEGRLEPHVDLRCR